MGGHRTAAFVVPGGLEAVTGGNLYDTYVIGALERNAWNVSVVERAEDVHADVVVVDSLAFRFGPPSTDAPYVALAHQLPSEASARPEWEEAESRTLRDSALVIVVAEHLRRSMKNLTRAPIEVVTPGWDHAWVEDGASLEGNTVICVANAFAGKGVPEAIRAFSAAAVPEAELVIAGDMQADEQEGRRVSAELERTDAAVRLEGVVSRETLIALYGTGRILLTASRYEGWPMAVAGAMASGIPVVGFDTPGLRDLVRSETDGVLVPLGDVAGLATAVADLFRNQRPALEMGHAARKRAFAWPTWQEAGDRFVRALERLVT